jgi:hypothetical protein
VLILRRGRCSCLCGDGSSRMLIAVCRFYVVFGTVKGKELEMLEDFAGRVLLFTERFIF